MARKVLSPIGEVGREWLKSNGLIDDRYSNAFKGLIAKETGEHKQKGK